MKMYMAQYSMTESPELEKAERQNSHARGPQRDHAAASRDSGPTPDSFALTTGRRKHLRLFPKFRMTVLTL